MASKGTSGFSLIELVAAAGFLAVLMASFYSSCRYLRKAEDAFTAEAMALHVMENVAARCEDGRERSEARVREVFDAEFQASPLAAERDVAHTCRAGPDRATLVVTWRSERKLARADIPLTAAAGVGTKAGGGMP